MRKSIQSFLKYSISLAVAVFLFWYLYKDMDAHTMLQKFEHLDMRWVYLSIFLSLSSHLVRAYRWNLLLQPLGYDLKTGRTYLAVMVGYFANFLVPRMGEVSRCGVLKRTDNVPMSAGIGSVVTERFIDVLCLLSIILLSLVLEFDRLSDFFYEFFGKKIHSLAANVFFLYTLAGVVIALGLIIYFILRFKKDKIKAHPLYAKITHFLRELVEGITSIRRLEKPWKFWASTVFMWILYYAMTYVVVFCMPETAHLDMLAGLTMLILGGLGMAAPVQGGIGAFHALMSAGLMLYGIPENDGKFFAFVLHSTNSFAVILVGAASLAISMVIKKRNAAVKANGNKE